MPPGVRPVSSNKATTVPQQTSFTAQVAAQGRDAFDARARAASYGLAGQQQALRDLAGQVQSGQQGYSSHPGQSDQYAQWQQQQGFRPQNYSVAFGRGFPDSKFSGYNTEADLKTAVTGSAELAREQDLQRAQQMKDMASAAYDTLGQTYDTNQLGAGAAFRDSRNRNPAGAEVLGQRLGDFNTKLENWYAQQADPLVSQMETANQIADTPTRQYEFRSGAQLGVAPELVAGWHLMGQDIQDAAQQRDLQSLRSTGLPYSEQQSTLRDIQSQQQQSTKQSAADQQQQMIDEVYGATSWPGDALASTVQAPLDVVHAVTTQPNFPSYRSMVQSAVQDARDAADAAVSDGSLTQSEADNQVASVLDQAIAQATRQIYSETGDQSASQVAERILRAFYGNL